MSSALQGRTAAPPDWVHPLGSALLGKHSHTTQVLHHVHRQTMRDMTFRFWLILSPLSIIKFPLCSVSPSVVLIYHFTHPSPHLVCPYHLSSLVTSASTVPLLPSQRRARQEAAAPQGPTAPRVPLTWFPVLQAPSAPQMVTDDYTDTLLATSCLLTVGCY